MLVIMERLDNVREAVQLHHTLVHDQLTSLNMNWPNYSKISPIDWMTWVIINRLWGPLQRQLSYIMFLLRNSLRSTYHSLKSLYPGVLGFSPYDESIWKP
jgi:hypothetical protein